MDGGAGGGRESNIKTMPFFMQMGLFLVDYKSKHRPPMELQMAQFLDSVKQLSDFKKTQDDVAYMLSLSLFMLPRSAWRENKFLFIQAAMVCNRSVATS